MDDIDPAEFQQFVMHDIDPSLFQQFLLSRDETHDPSDGSLWPKLSWGCNIAFLLGLVAMWGLSVLALYVFGWLIS